MGKILNCQIDSGMWAYAVEMEMGPPPESGRVGPETTILLYETEIQDVMHLGNTHRSLLPLLLKI